MFIERSKWCRTLSFIAVLVRIAVYYAKIAIGTDRRSQRAAQDGPLRVCALRGTLHPSKTQRVCMERSKNDDQCLSYCDSDEGRRTQCKSIKRTFEWFYCSRLFNIDLFVNPTLDAFSSPCCVVCSGYCNVCTAVRSFSSYSLHRI